jgi:hypothetical protein
MLRQERAGEKVLVHAQLAEWAPALRAMHQAAHADLVRREGVHALAVEAHLAFQHDVAGGAALHALLEAHQAGNRPQQRRLAGAIGPYQAYELPGADAERHAVQDLRPVVAHAEVVHLKQRHARSRGRPL